MYAEIPAYLHMCFEVISVVKISIDINLITSHPM